MTKSEHSRVQTKHNQRLIMNIGWCGRVRNVAIAAQIGLPHVVGTIIQRQRLALFGHARRKTSPGRLREWDSSSAEGHCCQEGRRVPRIKLAPFR